MGEKRSKLFLKTAIAILALCLCGLGFFTFQSYNRNQSHQEVLVREKAEIKLELQNLLANYEKAVQTNQQLKKGFLDAKQRIRRLLDSMNEQKATYVFLRKYKRQINTLKKEKEKLFRTIDSLSAKNKTLKNRVDSTKIQLVQTVQTRDSLKLRNAKLTEKISKASQLKIIGLTTQGVVLRNNGKTQTTEQAGKTDKIEVCFTLAENNLVKPGNKRFFIQIINPNHNLLGEKASISFEEAVLGYSKQVNVFYDNQKQKICALVAAKEEDLVKGKYLVHVFLGAELRSSSEFKLE